MPSLRSSFRAIRDIRVLGRAPVIGDLVRIKDIWGYQLIDDGFSLVTVWFPKIPRKGTGVLTGDTRSHWHIRFWCREIELPKANNVVQPLNRFGRMTAWDRIGQSWMAWELAAMEPPLDDPAAPPPPHPPNRLQQRLAAARGELESVHAFGGRYRSWFTLIVIRWLERVGRKLAGVPSQGGYVDYGLLVADCRSILTFTYRRELRRFRLDQIRRHYNGNIHFMGRQLPDGERRTFSFTNISNLSVEGFGPLDDSRLFIDLNSLEVNAAQHYARNSGHRDPSRNVLPPPDRTTRIVGRVWKAVSLPYWKYMKWRYPKKGIFIRRPLWQRVPQRVITLQKAVDRTLAFIHWLRAEYGPRPPKRRDLWSPHARWRVRLRLAADQIEAGTPPDVGELRHLAKLVKEPVLARRLARQIVQETLAGLPREHPQRSFLATVLRVSPAHRRVVPHWEKERALKTKEQATWFAVDSVISAEMSRPDPALVAFAYLQTVYGFYHAPRKPLAAQRPDREWFKALLILHLCDKSDCSWTFATGAPDRMRRLAAL